MLWAALSGVWCVPLALRRGLLRFPAGHTTHPTRWRSPVPGSLPQRGTRYPLPTLRRSPPPRGYSPSGRAVAPTRALSFLSAAPGKSATTLRLGCRLLAPWLGLRPVLYLRSLTLRHPRRPPDDCPPLRGCAVFLAIGRFLAAARRPSLLGSSLSCTAVRLVTLAAAPTARLRAHTHRGRESGALPRRAPSWLAGPRVPCFASPARYARARHGAGGLRESGVRLRRAFLSADA